MCHVFMKRTGLRLVQLMALWCVAVMASGCNMPGDGDGDGNTNTNDNSSGNENDNGGGDTTSRVITTVVGTGVAGQNGDIAARETALYLPQDTTVAPDGTLYFADWNNHRIRRVVDGMVETVAGTGELGDAPEGPALETQFNHPTNVTFDDNGHMIIAAWHNSKVMSLDLETGIVTDLAGTGGRAFGGDGGPGTEAVLDLPSSVVVDANGNILISDQANYRIRLLEPNGTIYTICGDGEPGYTGDNGRAEDAQLNSPKGQSAPPAGRIALNSRGEIIIADTGNHVIRVVDGAGVISTIAGTGEAGYAGDGGSALEAQFNTPSDVAVGPDDVIYVADTMNHVIRMIDADGTVTTIAGTGERGYSGDGGPAEAAQLDRPYGLSVSAEGDIYVADTHNHRIRKISAGEPDPDDGGDPVDEEIEIIPCTDEPGEICTYAGTGQSGFNGDGIDRLLTAFYWPVDIEFTPSGRTIVLDWNNHRVREILSDDTLTTIMGTDFIGDGPLDLSDLTEAGADPLTVNLNHPTDVQEFSNGDIALIAWHNHKIRTIDADTGRVRVLMGAGASFAGDGGPARDALVNQPSHAAFDADGNLFLIDQRNQRVRVLINFDEERGDATIMTVAGTGEKGFNGDGPALESQVAFPAGGNPEPTGGIAIDGEGNVYFCDSDNNRIRMISFPEGDFSAGVLTTVAGTGEAAYGGDGGPAVDAQIAFPQDIEIGPDGNVYFADTDNHRVRRIVVETGVIETVVGDGEPSYAGDGGDALSASLHRPWGVAFDKEGRLYVSDTFNGRIRRVNLPVE